MDIQLSKIKTLRSMQDWIHEFFVTKRDHSTMLTLRNDALNS